MSYQQYTTTQGGAQQKAGYVAYQAPAGYVATPPGMVAGYYVVPQQMVQQRMFFFFVAGS